MYYIAVDCPDLFVTTLVKCQQAILSLVKYLVGPRKPG